MRQRSLLAFLLLSLLLALCLFLHAHTVVAADVDTTELSFRDLANFFDELADTERDAQLEFPQVGEADSWSVVVRNGYVGQAPRNSQSFAKRTLTTNAATRNSAATISISGRGGFSLNLAGGQSGDSFATVGRDGTEPMAVWLWQARDYPGSNNAAQTKFYVFTNTNVEMLKSLTDFLQGQGMLPGVRDSPYPDVNFKPKNFAQQQEQEEEEDEDFEEDDDDAVLDFAEASDDDNDDAVAELFAEFDEDEDDDSREY